MTEITILAVRALSRLPPAVADEIARRIIVEVAKAEQDERTRRCAA